MTFMTRLPPRESEDQSFALNQRVGPPCLGIPSEASLTGPPCIKTAERLWSNPRCRFHERTPTTPLSSATPKVLQTQTRRFISPVGELNNEPVPRVDACRLAAVISVAIGQLP